MRTVTLILMACAIIAIAALSAPALAQVTVAGAAGQGVIVETAQAPVNCQAFPDAAGHALMFAGGTTASGNVVFVQLFDAAGPSPTTPQIVPATRPDALGNFRVDFRPALALKVGLLICTSSSADPTQWTAAPADMLAGAGYQ